MEINEILAKIYKELIDKSWENGDTFEAYQDAWSIVEKHFKIRDFDWTKGQRPKHGLNLDQIKFR